MNNLQSEIKIREVGDIPWYITYLPLYLEQTFFRILYFAKMLAFHCFHRLLINFNNRKLIDVFVIFNIVR